MRRPPIFSVARVPDGRAAVQMFYLISGFYMALILNEKYRRPTATGIFYSNRFLRLWPAVFIVNVLVVRELSPMGEVRSVQAHTPASTGFLGFWARLYPLDPGLPRGLQSLRRRPGHPVVS
jgi:peptidoglycan/LPS O-acetylase OafA/YrhL